jgi:selenide,water dikinase
MRKGGLVPGDVLVLTKAIGTGVVLAGHMRGLARARWLEATLVAMCVPSGPAAAILAAHGARGMTDVTGFGLIGHLVEMTRASGVGAELVLDRIPVLPGARELAARGVASSLLPQNLRLREAIRDPADAEALPMFPLLFDPQTAGGLLAGVPAERADACVTALRAARCGRAPTAHRRSPCAPRPTRPDAAQPNSFAATSATRLPWNFATASSCGSAWRSPFGPAIMPAPYGLPPFTTERSESSGAP